MMRRDTAAADPESVTVRIQLNRLDPLQEHLTDDILKTFNIEHPVVIRGFLKRQAKRTNTASSYLYKKSNGFPLLAPERLLH
jgi:hypothetical protein